MHIGIRLAVLGLCLPGLPWSMPVAGASPATQRATRLAPSTQADRDDRLEEQAAQIRKLREDLTRLRVAFEDLTLRTRPRQTQPPAPAKDPLAQIEKEITEARGSQPVRPDPRSVFNPQISVVTDFVYRNSSLDESAEVPDTSGRPTGDRGRDRFSVREIEVAFQSAIDPFSRADIFLELPGVLEEFADDAAAAAEPKIEVEEAYISYWRLPWGLRLKGGKFRLEFGKNNIEHNDNQHAVERPLVISNFFGAEGIAEQGLGLQKVFTLGGPGTQLELTAQLVNGEGGEESLFGTTASDKTMGLGRARLYHEIEPSLNIDLGTSHLSGRHDAPGQRRQRVRGYDLTLRYEPVRRLAYQQFILRAEVLRGDRKVGVDFTGDNLADFAIDQEPDGAYVMAQYQFDRNWKVGLRHDSTNAALRMAQAGAAANGGDRLRGVTGWLTHLTSEFSRFRLELTSRETTFPVVGNKRGEDIVILQWQWAMGPHGAHKY